MDKDVVAKQLKEAQVLQNEILRKSRDHESLNSEGDDLRANSDKDQEAVTDILNGINNR